MWPFGHRKPKVSPKIPVFKINDHLGKEPTIEPKVEPLTVDSEVRDPTDTMISRFKDLIKVRFK